MSTRFYQQPASWTVGLTFLFLNMSFGSWLSRLPEVQRNLALSESTLGLVLLAMPVGAMISTTISRDLLARFEPGRLAIICVLVFTGAMLFPALAGSALVLAILLFCIGLSDGLLNVSMNTAAAAIEAKDKVRIMSSCHGMFSLGGFIGALIGGSFAKLGIGLPVQMLIIFLIALTTLLIRLPTLWHIKSDISREKQAFRWPGLRLMAFILIGICIMIGEGAISDWSAIYLSKQMGAGPLIAALGFAGFSASMAIGRFSGDRVRSFIRPRSLLRNGSLLSTAGLLLAVFGNHPSMAIIGFTMAGIGFATSVPILFLEAGKTTPDNPAVGIAAVANAGLVGFLAAPPAIGFIAEHFGLDQAFLIIAILAFMAAVGSHFFFPK
ncbi:MAG: MFS transporter [Bacteroidota bacterium]